MKVVIKFFNNILTKRFFIRLFLFSIFAVILKKVITSPITDSFALGMMGFIGGLILLKGKKNAKKN